MEAPTTSSQQQQQQQQVPAADVMGQHQDGRLLEAASAGQTDLVLHLLEENGNQLHGFKDHVREMCSTYRNSI